MGSDDRSFPTIGARLQGASLLRRMPALITQQPKRLLVRRLQSVRAVLWALDVFAPRLRRTERPFVAELRLGLERRRDALTRTERQLRRRERLRSRRVRHRNRAAKELRVLMVAGRGLSSHLFGDDKLAEIGFAQRVEEAAEALLEQAVAVVDTLRDPAFVAPKPLLRTFAPDLRDLATDLEPAIGKVRGALEDLEAARCDVRLALHDRNEALEAFNRDFLHVARIVEGLLRRAGLDDLADRVRPSTRRRGTTRVPFVEDQATPLAETSTDAAVQAAQPSAAAEVAGPLRKVLPGIRPREGIPGSGGNASDTPGVSTDALGERSLKTA